MVTAGIREASRLIFVDELTGLYNRRFMRQYLRERLNQFLESRTPLCVLMFDLDGFKEVNDTHGHMEGDFVLKRLAQMIRGALPPGSYAIRFAGDEFIVFLEGVDAAGGMTVADDIRERVATSPFCTRKVPDGITLQVSVGVAAWPEDASTASSLIEAADAALYQSKRSGKNTVTRSCGSGLSPEEEFRKRLPSPQIIGRQTEFEELLRPLRIHSGQRHRLLLVEGHKGLGKTRVLTEVMQSPEARRARCFFQLCAETHHAIPYSTIVRSVTDCLEREPQQIEVLQSKLSPEHLAVLMPIIPVLGNGDSPTGDSDEDNGDGAGARRSQLFFGLVEALRLLSEHSTLVLFLDDIHIADDASLEVITRLLSEEVGDLIVYAACRTDAISDTEGSEALRRFFAELIESPSFLVVSLCPLTPPELEQMLAAILKQYVPSPAFLQQLFEASAGIPLFVEETLKGLIAHGGLRFDSGSWDLKAVSPAAIPESLEAAVFQGLAILDEETQAMINKAAVAGPRVDLNVLAEVLGKDPGETQQLVDRGKQHRVFEEQGPLADEDEVRFLSECFREVVYTGMASDERSQTHRAVGEAKEKIAGPKGAQDLGSLAFHFKRSDDLAKAKHYGDRVHRVSTQLFSAVELHRQLGIDEHGSDNGDCLNLGVEKPLEPLDEHSLQLAQQFLRSLPLAIKNLRLYPEDNQLVEQSVSAATKSLLELLQSTDAVGFAEADKGLLINGEPVKGAGLRPAAEDLLKIYDDHAVRRCTFERGITSADITGLLRMLSDTPESQPLEQAEWVERITAAGIDHARIFPVIFLESDREEAGWHRDNSERLDKATLPLVRNVLRSLAAVVDNIRLYPSESELITLTLDQLAGQTSELFVHIPSLTVAKAEGAVVINATRANPRQFGITIEVLEKLIEDNGLVSLTLRAGVTRKELHEFLSQLATPTDPARRTPEFWPGVLEASGIRNIQVGSLKYAAAGAEEGCAPASPQGAPSPGIEEGEAPPLDEEQERVDAWLGTSLEDHLAADTQAEIAVALADLHGSGRQDLARQLADRTLAALTQGEGTHRHHAAKAMGVWLQTMDESIDWLLDSMVLSVADSVSAEKEAEAFGSEVELASQLLGHLLDRAELPRGSRLADALIRAEEDKERERGFAATVRRQLEALGPDLLELVVTGDDIDTARRAAKLIRAQGPNASRAMRRALQRAKSAEQIGRILAVLDVVEPEPGPELFFLLSHPNAGVRIAMAEALTRLDRDGAVKFLRRAMAQPDAEVVLGALGCVWQLGEADLVEAVLALIEEPPSDHVLTTACQWLGTLSDTRAVDALVELLSRRPKLFGLVRGTPEAARVTAARALAEVDLPRARAGLRYALKDPSVTVRATARQALDRG